VTADQRQDPFDSLFEQRVYLRIRERGYQVTPQWEVNGRRIDLVVTGLKGRLAVECDGEAWHSTPEQRQNDLYREQELKRAGWQFWRVRESEFVWNPEAALEDLWTTLDRRGIRPDEGTEVVDEQRSVVVRAAVVQHQSEPTWAAAPPTTDRGRAVGAPTLPEPCVDPLFGPVAPSGSSVAAAGVPAAEVRSWAKAQGHRVGERGRMSPEVVDAWNAAHPSRPYSR
jgi:very-short-patch-repair endonuclease